MRQRGKNRRDRIVAYVRNYTTEYGQSPSIDEIAIALGTVKSNVYHHLRQLEQDGVAVHRPGRARSWMIRGEG